MKAGLFLATFLLTSAMVSYAGPPVARFQSVLGNFDVLLDPVAAPRSVENFSAYANRGTYDTSFIHRSTTYNPADIQIVQGGGFKLVGGTIEAVPADPPIPLEAGMANARGTIAMARTDQPDSATSQWYFNVTDNPGLDFNYAVFGRVLGEGLGVIEAIGDIAVYSASTQQGLFFGQLPLIEGQYLVLINSVRVEPFAITKITHNGTETELRWTPLSANTPVRVERATDIAARNWTAIATNLTGGTFIDTNSPTGAAYYRLVTEP
jgi:peptidyl-prolyl cis-trans isomerase A (cyclophilin A)